MQFIINKVYTVHAKNVNVHAIACVTKMNYIEILQRKPTIIYLVSTKGCLLNIL